MADGLADGLELMEVEFPAVPGEDASYKAGGPGEVKKKEEEGLITLMKERLPSLHAHFEASGVLPLLPIVTTQWFISLFVFWLSTECLLRLWDNFFFDGLKSRNKVFFYAPLRQPE